MELPIPPAPLKRRRGRPVGFDRDAALRQAMRLFWERGYEGTTFDDLIGAMGISPSSFYAAFGSKERLFDECLDAYTAESDARFDAALATAPTARAAAEGALAGAVIAFTRAGEPAGCMVATACLTVSPALGDLRDRLAAQRRRTEATLAARIRRGIAEGDTPPGTDPVRLASFLATVLNGMAVQARDGASPAQLESSAAFAMSAWPGPDSAPSADHLAE